MAKAKYTRGSDGYFQTRIWDGTYIDGEKHRKTIRSDKSSRDLENKVNAFKAEVEMRNNVRKTDETFLNYARSWKNLYKASKEANTRAMYDNIIEKHFSAISYLRLQDVDRIHLQTLLNNAAGKKRTQQQIYMVFKQVLKSAVADHVFPANVFEDIFSSIAPPKYQADEKRALTSAEKNAIFKAAFKEDDKIFIYLLYGCGLRRGEALALTVFDVNTNTHELTVSKSHEFVGNAPRAKLPKSKNGVRTVPIPDVVYKDIEKYVHQRRLSGKTYLFTMRYGKPLSKSSYDKKWARIIKAMQETSEVPIANLTAHVFRHNYCTQLCYQIPSISIRHIAQLLGDTEKMVLSVYNHIVLEREDAETAVNSAMNF